MINSSAPLTTIGIADDHPVVTEGLSHFLSVQGDFKILWATGSGSEVLPNVKRQPPDVLVLDLKLPGTSGFEILRNLRRDHPSVSVAILTSYSQDEYIRSAYSAGVRGFLRKSMALEEIAAILRRIQKGELVLSDEDQRLLAGAPEQRLSMRETQILDMIAEGLSNKMIADRLAIKEGTVKAHTNNIFKKLGVNSRTEAIRAAFENGMLQINSMS